MSIFYKAKKLDFASGGEAMVVLREKEAENQGIMPGDRITLKWKKDKGVTATVQYTNSKVAYGEVGLFEEIWRTVKLKDDEVAEISLISRPASIQAIRKKLLGKTLNYQEIYDIMTDISSGKLGKVETAYFAASSFSKPLTNDELYFMTKAMAESGEQMNLGVKVVDKHSIGGIPGNRTTMLVIPIIASLGLFIPKTSSRAITSPSGTADTMEVLAPVALSLNKIKEVINKTKACLVWGGGMNIAAADDKLIKVEKIISLETFDKMIVSIMAKKVAMGVDYLIIDLPYGETAKVSDLATVAAISDKFKYLGKKFGIRVKVMATKAEQPIGAGIGPALEARDVLRVLQQHELRPLDLERKAIMLAGELLELKKYCRLGAGKELAERQIKSGAAWQKMNEIIMAQGGKKNLRADEVALGALRYEIHAKRAGRVRTINNKAIEEICVNLGAPREKLAGIHLHCRLGDKVEKGQKLFTLYAENQSRLDLGLLAVKKDGVVNI